MIAKSGSSDQFSNNNQDKKSVTESDDRPEIFVDSLDKTE